MTCSRLRWVEARYGNETLSMLRMRSTLAQLAVLLAVLRPSDRPRVIGDIDAGLVARAPGRIFEPQAAVDRDVDAGQEARFIRSQKHRRPRQIGCAREPLERNGFEEVVARIMRPVRAQDEFFLRDLF